MAQSPFRYVLNALLTLAACSPHLSEIAHAPSATVSDCLSPARDWIADSLRNHSRLALSGEIAETEVRCEALGRQGPAGGWLGVGRIVVNTELTSGEFEYRFRTLHELIHDTIARGPHPERVYLHICRDPGPGCAPVEFWCRDAVMAPASQEMMAGDPYAHVDTGSVAQTELQECDVRFVRWATTP